jgi:hypothetical protein
MHCRRGAISVEVAILLPLLVSLLFGITEVGLAWNTSNRMADVTRSAVIELSRDPQRRHADLDVIRRVRDSIGSTRDEVRSIMVYKVDTATGRATPVCAALASSITTGTAGVSGECNVYAGASLADLDSARFSSPDCRGEPDQWLCPARRRAVIGSGSIGVQVAVEHTWRTLPRPGGPQIIVDRGAATLEPALSSLETSR